MLLSSTNVVCYFSPVFGVLEVIPLSEAPPTSNHTSSWMDS